MDNYRDEIVIDKLLENISCCFNYLLMFYVLKGKEFKIGLFLYKTINAVQELFNKCVFKQSPEKINSNSLNNNNNLNINFEDTLMIQQLENLNFYKINLKTILSHCNTKINNFIDYIIMLGTLTNDDFLKQQCALIILSIFHKFTLKENTETF